MWGLTEVVSPVKHQCQFGSCLAFSLPSRPLMEFEAGLSFWGPVHRHRAVGVMSTGTWPP